MSLLLQVIKILTYDGIISI